jgi:hypothetical protein
MASQSCSSEIQCSRFSLEIAIAGRPLFLHDVARWSGAEYPIKKPADVCGSAYSDQPLFELNQIF